MAKKWMRIGIAEENIKTGDILMINVETGHIKRLDHEQIGEFNECKTMNITMDETSKFPTDKEIKKMTSEELEDISFKLAFDRPFTGINKIYDPYRLKTDEEIMELTLDNYTKQGAIDIFNAIEKREAELHPYLYKRLKEKFNL